MLKRMVGVIFLVCMLANIIPALASTNTEVIIDVSTGKTETDGCYLDVSLDKPVNGVLGVAFYENKRMTAVQTKKIDIDTEFPIHIDAPDSSFENAKVFIWNSLGYVKPLGDAKDVTSSASNLKIMHTGATIQSKEYDNIIIAPEIGDGEVTLESVTINGDLIVLGGGSNSIHLDGCVIKGKVVLNKATGEEPRLTLNNNTVLDLVEVKRSAILDREDYESYVKKVVTTANLTSNGQVSPLIEVDEATNSDIVINIQDVYGVDVIVNSNCNIAINSENTYQNVVRVTTELEEEPSNITVNNSPLSHFCQWGEPETVSEPSCYEYGRKKVYCSTGNHTQWYDIPKLPHELTGETSYFDSMHWYICKNCTDCVNIGNHYFPDDFNCETGGKCVVCEYKVSAGNHKYGMYSITTPPTCSSTGIQSATCSYCGRVSEQTVYKLTHSFPNEPDRVVEPTCTTEGAKYYQCTNGYGCTYEKTEKLYALGHTTDVRYTITKEATCSEEGSKVKICTRCNDIIDTEVIPKTEHTKGAGTVTTSSTCTSKGCMTYQCSECGSAFTDEIDYKEHNFINGQCSVCNEYDFVDVSSSSELSSNIQKGQSVRLLCDFETVYVSPQNGATIFLNGFKIGTLSVSYGDLIVDGEGGGSIDTVMISGNKINLSVRNTSITTKFFANRSGVKLALENCDIQTLTADYADLLTLKNCSIKSYSKINMIKKLDIESISASENDLVIDNCDKVTVNGASEIDIIASNNKSFTINHSEEHPISVNEFRCSGAENLTVNGGLYKKSVYLSKDDNITLNNPVMAGGLSCKEAYQFTINGGEYYTFEGSTTSDGSIVVRGGTFGSGAEYISSSISSDNIQIFALDAKDNLNVRAKKLTVAGVNGEKDATFAGTEALTVNAGNTIKGETTFVTDGIANIYGGTYLNKSIVERSLYSETGSFIIHDGIFGNKTDARDSLEVRADTRIQGGDFRAENHGVYIIGGSTVIVDGNAAFDTGHEPIQCYNGVVYITSYDSSSYYILADTNTDGNIESNGAISHTIRSSAGDLVLRKGFSTTKDVDVTCANAASYIYFEDGIVVEGKLKLSNARDGMIDGISGGILGGTYYGETTISGRYTDLTIAGGTFEKITFTSLSDSSVLITGGTFNNFNVDSGNKVIITGGTFNVDVSQYVNKDLYSVVQNQNGTYTVINK